MTLEKRKHLRRVWVNKQKFSKDKVKKHFKRRNSMKRGT